MEAAELLYEVGQEKVEALAHACSLEDENPSPKNCFFSSSNTYEHFLMCDEVHVKFSVSRILSATAFSCHVKRMYTQGDFLLFAVFPVDALFETKLLQCSITVQ